MKIRIVIPCWKRPEITKFCFGELKKLQQISRHTLDVLCIISEDDYIPICESLGFDWLMYKNNPLGEKINAGIKKSLDYKWDYLMTMNSDSVIREELFDFYEEYFKRDEKYFGVDTVYFLDSKSGECRKYLYNFTILGVAKCIRRDVVESMKGNLYRNDLNSCLDNTMMDNMIKAGAYPKIVKYKGQLVFDVKSEVNIWPFSHFEKKGEKVESELCYR